MMFNRRSLEGYLMIDHRESPGLDHPTMPIGKETFFESATINCSHCERMVVLNPQRTRERAYCPKCDAYLCDACGAERVRTGVCKPFKQVIDEFIDAAAKGHLNG